ncbi:MAG: CapA family protein [Alkalispirochaetaceae bacterium]
METDRATAPATARTPREFVQLPRGKAILYATALKLLEWSRAWRYPIAASGDYEEMGFRDILYWIHKTEHHITRPQRGSQLASYFPEHQALPRRFPEDFEVEAELSIAAVGDLMDHEYLNHSARLYREIGETLFGADISMANLEAVVLDEPSEAPQFDGRSAPRLRIGRETLDVLTSHAGRRYDFLSVACNHTLDFGTEGIDHTREALESRGIAYHGTNASAEEAGRAALLTRRGISVAIISHTFGLNGWRPPPDRPWAVNRTRLNESPEGIDLSLMRQQIADARRGGADFVIAQLHWGMEFEHYPRVEQIELAHTIAEAGVDAILGHHPHVLQPWELYRTRRDPERLVPIFYSLGNLTNPFRDPRLCRSLLGRMTLSKGRRRDGSVSTYVTRLQSDLVEQSVDVDERRVSLEAKELQSEDT